MNIAMTIAGSDSGGGAGIQADLKTFQELGVFGTSAITAITAQNTLGVEGIQAIETSLVAKQIEVVFNDFEVSAVKTGMLFSSEIIEVVAQQLRQQAKNCVLDPVMIAKGGASLLQQEAVEAFIKHLVPLATVLTPNIPEAEVLTGISICNQSTLQQAAEELLQMGANCVVLKGGHMSGEQAIDTVYFKDGQTFKLVAPRIDTKHTHGTGCTFSAAITAFLAKGYTIQAAITEAKHFIHQAIAYPLNIGHGHGPTNHFAYNKQQSASEVEIIGS